MRQTPSSSSGASIAEGVVDHQDGNKIDAEDEKMTEVGAGQAPAVLPDPVQGPLFPALPRKRKLSDRQKVCYWQCMSVCLCM